MSKDENLEISNKTPLRTSFHDLVKEKLKNDNLEKSKNSDESKLPHSELFYLGINCLYVITNGVNHIQFKYTKQQVGLENYTEYSFTIWRCFFIMIINTFRMKLWDENCDSFEKLKFNKWFWCRSIIQFVAWETMLLLIKYFRVSTATCFISMAPVAIVIMSCILLREKFYMRYIYGIFICFSGVWLIVNNESKNDKDEHHTEMSIGTLAWGIFFGLAQLISVALHKVSSKALVKENIQWNTQIMYPSGACIILSVIFMLLQGEPFKYGTTWIWECFLNSLVWLLSTILMLVSYGGIDLIKTTAIGYLNIITVFILGVLFLGEYIYWTDIVGSLIILAFNIYNTINPPHD